MPKAFFCSLILILVPTLSHSQETALEEYEYDELGRLVKVIDQGAPKIFYCYDPAGNRVKVNSQGEDIENCELSVPVPPKPTSLDVSSHAGGGCYWRWSGSEDAAYYAYELEDSTVIKISAPADYADHNTLCVNWIRACNTKDECSSKAHF